MDGPDQSVMTSGFNGSASGKDYGDVEPMSVDYTENFSPISDDSTPAPLKPLLDFHNTDDTGDNNTYSQSSSPFRHNGEQESLTNSGDSKLTNGNSQNGNHMDVDDEEQQESAPDINQVLSEIEDLNRSIGQVNGDIDQTVGRIPTYHDEKTESEVVFTKDSDESGNVNSALNISNSSVISVNSSEHEGQPGVYNSRSHSPVRGLIDESSNISVSVNSAESSNDKFDQENSRQSGNLGDNENSNQSDNSKESENRNDSPGLDNENSNEPHDLDNRNPSCDLDNENSNQSDVKILNENSNQSSNLDSEMENALLDDERPISRQSSISLGDNLSNDSDKPSTATSVVGEDLDQREEEELLRDSGDELEEEEDPEELETKMEEDSDADEDEDEKDLEKNDQEKKDQDVELAEKSKIDEEDDFVITTNEDNEVKDDERKTNRLDDKIEEKIELDDKSDDENDFDDDKGDLEIVEDEDTESAADKDEFNDKNDYIVEKYPRREGIDPDIDDTMNFLLEKTVAALKPSEDMVSFPVSVVPGQNSMPTIAQRSPNLARSIVPPLPKSMIPTTSAPAALPQPPPLKRAPAQLAEEAKKAAAPPPKVNELRPSVQFLYDIGLSLAKQMVYRELIDTQAQKEKSGKLDKDGKKQLQRLRAQSRETDEKTDHLRFKCDKKCLGCLFKTESQNVLYWHKEHPHEGQREELYCAHCNFTTWNRLTYTKHMEQRHSMQGRLHPKTCSHRCPTCQYDTNAKHNYLKHSLKCGKTFNIRFNLIPSTSLHVNFSFTEGFYKIIKKPQKPVPPPLKIAPVRPVNVSLLTPKTAQQLQQRLLRPPIAGTVSSIANTNVVRTQSLGNIRTPILLPYGKLLIPQGGVLSANQLPRGTRPLYIPRPPRGPVPRGMPAVPMLTQRPVARNVTPTPPAMMQQRNVRPQQINQTPPPQPKQSSMDSIGAYAAKNNLISCEICGGFVKDRMALRVHFHFAHKIDLPLSILDAGSEPNVTCGQCKAKYWTQTGLALHMKNTRHTNTVTTPAVGAGAIGATIYSCFVCKQKVQYLLNHMSAVHNLTLADFVNARRCCICNMSFRHNNQLVEHLKKVHTFDLNMNGGSISIKYAPVGIIAPTTYSQKILKQASQCSLCKANFANNTLLTQHCLRVHVNCVKCGVVFSDRNAYNAHTCKIFQQQICQICKRYISQKRFRIHVEGHHLKRCRVNLKRYSDEQIDTLAKCPKVSRPVLDKAVFPVSTSRSKSNFHPSKTSPFKSSPSSLPATQSPTLNEISKPTNADEPIVIDIDSD